MLSREALKCSILFKSVNRIDASGNDLGNVMYNLLVSNGMPQADKIVKISDGLRLNLTSNEYYQAQFLRQTMCEIHGVCEADSRKDDHSRARTTSIC